MLNISGVCGFLFPITDVISIVPLKLTYLGPIFSGVLASFGGNHISKTFSFTPFVCSPLLSLKTHLNVFFSPNRAATRRLKKSTSDLHLSKTWDTQYLPNLRRHGKPRRKCPRALNKGIFSRWGKNDPSGTKGGFSFFCPVFFLF